MLDQFGRRITYLRISVIDKCNLRCLYCMPKGSVSKSRVSELLTNDEVVELAAMFAELGVTKIRLTGGEPLLRPGLVEMVGRLSRIPGITQLVLSTNGVLLARHAEALQKAGLRRINVSLDTLSREKFTTITGMDQWQTVVEGILEAKAVGLEPVKVNTVLMKGVNDDEILPLVGFAIEQELELRFIEWMPTNPLVDVEREGRFFSNEVAKAHIEQHYRLIPDDLDPHSPARSFIVNGTRARVGFINPLSNVFCAMCNRVRLKANGRIKTCLHGKEELDLKTMLRTGVSREAITRQIATAVFLRPEQHFLNRPEVAHQDFVMTHIGG
ncbi:MAG: GTP 3',8-cyclase MoaA [Candidatus Omnitrophica bacterium]|nr:GTP 3',8-cyclase MoaA [Candidatus Omnitrophota bacterium]